MRNPLIHAVTVGFLATMISGCMVGADGSEKKGPAPTEHVGQSEAADNVPGCGQTRWSMKVATDANKGSISGTATSYTVSQLNAISNPYSGQPASTGISETPARNGSEYTLVDVKAYLDIVKYENSSTGDSDYHLGIVDPADTTKTMIAEMPWSGSASGCGQYGCNSSSYNNSGNGASYGCVGQYFDLSSPIVWNAGKYALTTFAATRSWFDNMPYAPWIGGKLISGYLDNGSPCQCAQTTAGVYNSCSYTTVGTCHSDTMWMTIHLQGVIFYDALHGQTDVAANAVEIHPVTKFCIASSGGDCTPGNSLMNGGNW
jgi:hypothetical protein